MHTLEVDTTKIFNTVEPISQLATAESFERVGSMIWWEVKGGIDLTLDEAKDKFRGTQLEDFIQPVTFCEAINRFAEKLLRTHGTLYKNLDYLTGRLGDGYVYLSLYTGNIKAKDSTEFGEKAKYMFGENGNYFAVLTCDKEWLVSDYQEAADLFKSCYRIIHKDIQEALRNYSNKFGYRFNDHGGHYFIPRSFTDDLYNIQEVIKSFNQSLSISPIICGSDKDLEPIIDVLGKGFKDEIEQAEINLFEICLKEYGYELDWEEWIKNLKDRDISKLESSKISNSRYGKKLLARVKTWDENASNNEFQQLIKPILRIKPDKNKSIKKMYGIRDGLKESIEKLKVAGESPMINRWLNTLLEDVSAINNTVEKVSQKAIGELLSIV